MGISIYSNYATKLFSLEEELHSCPVTKELPEEIVQELNVIHEELSQLEKSASQVNQFAKSFLDDLRQKAVFLYGEIDDFYHKHAIEVIRQETEHLLEMPSEELAMTLKEHVEELLQSYRPALTERRVLVLAALALEEVEISESALLEAEAVIEEIADYLGREDRKGVQDCLRRLAPGQRKLVLAYLDTSLLHDIEGAADNDKIVRLG
jgi:hypothetical protein